jgi:threonine-phosphate decarboxylase
VVDQRVCRSGGEIALKDRAYQQATWRWLAQEGSRFYQALRQLPGLTVYPGRANYLFTLPSPGARSAAGVAAAAYLDSQLR